ncbi:hypothetical protein UY3_02388 [Chelonia mydas]|uniref:Uncharacterized protein n=1 Tax=Chelonia mydas TaxID=8469 RepID=M7CHK6_CHEMY|nr:hypothetical protein UY3_02388 [Chelonia mydas]
MFGAGSLLRPHLPPPGDLKGPPDDDATTGSTVGLRQLPAHSRSALFPEAASKSLRPSGGGVSLHAAPAPSAYSAAPIGQKLWPMGAAGVVPAGSGVQRPPSTLPKNRCQRGVWIAFGSHPRKGPDRDTLQCRVKEKELRNAFHKAREANCRSRAVPMSCQFYKELDAILSGDLTSTAKAPVDILMLCMPVESELSQEKEILDEDVEGDPEAEDNSEVRDACSQKLFSTLEEASQSQLSELGEVPTGEEAPGLEEELLGWSVGGGFRMAGGSRVLNITLASRELKMEQTWPRRGVTLIFTTQTHGPECGRYPRARHSETSSGVIAAALLLNSEWSSPYKPASVAASTLSYCPAVATSVRLGLCFEDDLHSFEGYKPRSNTCSDSHSLELHSSQ